MSGMTRERAAEIEARVHAIIAAAEDVRQQCNQTLTTLQQEIRMELGAAEQALAEAEARLKMALADGLALEARRRDAVNVELQSLRVASFIQRLAWLCFGRIPS